MVLARNLFYYLLHNQQVALVNSEKLSFIIELIQQRLNLTLVF